MNYRAAAVVFAALLMSGCGGGDEKAAACEAWDELKVVLAEADFGSLPEGEDWPPGAATPVMNAVGAVQKLFIAAAIADDDWDSTYKAALGASSSGFTVSEVTSSPDGRLVQESCDRLS